MNIQSGQLRPARTGGGGNTAGVWSKVWLAVKAAFFCIVAAALFNVNIYLRQKIAETDRNIRRIDREIADTRRDLERLRADYAELTSWPHIRRRIAELNLPLSAPRPGQIRELQLPPMDEYLRNSGRRRSAADRMARAK